MLGCAIALGSAALSCERTTSLDVPQKMKRGLRNSLTKHVNIFLLCLCNSCCEGTCCLDPGLKRKRMQAEGALFSHTAQKTTRKTREVYRSPETTTCSSIENAGLGQRPELKKGWYLQRSLNQEALNCAKGSRFPTASPGPKLYTLNLSP